MNKTNNRKSNQWTRPEIISQVSGQDQILESQDDNQVNTMIKNRKSSQRT